MKTYQETIDFFGTIIANQQKHLFLGGVIDWQINLEIYSKIISYIYSTKQTKVTEDLNISILRNTD